MAPAFGPFFRGFRNGLQSFTKGVGGGLIILLVKERFTHAEICQRPAGLNGERALILPHGIVEAALFSEIFAAGDGRASTQPSAALEDDVVGIDLDTTGFGPAKSLDGEARFGADHVDCFLLRISLRVDA